MMREPPFIPHANPHLVMTRRSQIEDLLDPRARWPDGTPREIPVPLYERLKAKELAKEGDL